MVCLAYKCCCDSNYSQNKRYVYSSNHSYEVTELLEKIDKILDSYPKFSIIVGAKGSGKKTIVKHICNICP